MQVRRTGATRWISAHRPVRWLLRTTGSWRSLQHTLSNTGKNKKYSHFPVIRGCNGERKLLEFYFSPQRLLTSSFFSTLLHPHLLPQGVNWYKIDGTHAWVDPWVCAHVDQPAGFHTCRQDGLSCSATEIAHLLVIHQQLLLHRQKVQTSVIFSRKYSSSYFSVFKSATKLIKGFFFPSRGGIYGTGMGAESPQRQLTVVSQEKQRLNERYGSPALTDGVHAGHDGDDGAVVVTVIKDVQHCGSITPNSWQSQRGE